MKAVFTGWLKSTQKADKNQLSTHRGDGDILTVLQY